MSTPEFPYVWRWTLKGARLDGQDRKGQRCRVIRLGPLNSALVEFEDGYRVMTSRNGLRRAEK